MIEIIEAPAQAGFSTLRLTRIDRVMQGLPGAIYPVSEQFRVLAYQALVD